MLTFTTFTLLAVSLFTTATAILAMRREREELKHSSTLLNSVIELEKELTNSYEHQSDMQADIAELNQQLQSKEFLLVNKTKEIKTLQEAVFETKESFIPWVESLQYESDEWAEIAKDRANDLTLVRAQATQAHEDLQVLIAKLDKGELTPNELAYGLSWISATLTPSESSI